MFILVLALKGNRFGWFEVLSDPVHLLYLTKLLLSLTFNSHYSYSPLSSSSSSQLESNLPLHPLHLHTHLPIPHLHLHRITVLLLSISLYIFIFLKLSRFSFYGGSLWGDHALVFFETNILFVVIRMNTYRI